MIIGITGLHRDEAGSVQTIGAGKDAAAEVLIAKHGFVRIGLADPLKRICREVFDFSIEQLWGPSQERNKPDRRYMRGGKHGASNMQTYLTYKNEREELERLRPEGYESLHKDALRAEAEWESLAYLTPRHALQQLGTEWGRDCHDSIWISYGLRLAKAMLADEKQYAYTAAQGLVDLLNNPRPAGWPIPLKGVVFSDVRFFNEYTAIKEAGGKVVRVRRFSWMKFPAGVDKAHASETQLSGYSDDKFDYVIDNSGSLHDLAMNVDRMHDVLTGRIIPYDESQKDVPPGLRKLPA